MSTTAPPARLLVLLLVLVAGIGAWAAMKSEAAPAWATTAPAPTDSPHPRPRGEFTAASLAKAAPIATDHSKARGNHALENTTQLSVWIPAAWQGGVPADLMDATVAISNLHGASGLADGSLTAEPTVPRRRPRRAAAKPELSDPRSGRKIHRFLHTSSP